MTKYICSHVPAAHKEHDCRIKKVVMSQSARQQHTSEIAQYFHINELVRFAQISPGMLGFKCVSEPDCAEDEQKVWTSTVWRACYTCYRHTLL